MNGGAAMKTDTLALCGCADCLFLLQGEGLYVQRDYQITGSAKYLYVVNLPHSVAGRERRRRTRPLYTTEKRQHRRRGLQIAATAQGLRFLLQPRYQFTSSAAEGYSDRRLSWPRTWSR